MVNFAMALYKLILKLVQPLKIQSLHDLLHFGIIIDGWFCVINNNSSIGHKGLRRWTVEFHL
jgi:hypothetical protein